MIEVIKPGLYSSIQDKGRFGFENYGVPISGSMDQFSSILSNKIISNNDNDAVMEITMIGPTLKFKTETTISITGADMSPLLNGENINLLNTAELRFVNEDGRYTGNLGDYLSMRISVLGWALIWFTKKDKLYWRFSIAKKIYKNIWLHIEVGAFHRYIFKIKLKNIKILGFIYSGFKFYLISVTDPDMTNSVATLSITK